MFKSTINDVINVKYMFVSNHVFSVKVLLINLSIVKLVESSISNQKFVSSNSHIYKLY